MKKNKILWYVFFLIVLAALVFLVFNDSGVIKYVKLKSQVNELGSEAQRKQIENKNREAEIDSLEKKNPAKIEQVARERYGMVKKGEKIIKLEEK